MKSFLFAKAKIKIVISLITTALIYFVVPIPFCFYSTCKLGSEIADCIPSSVCTTQPLYNLTLLGGFSPSLIKAILYIALIFIVIYIFISIIIAISGGKKEQQSPENEENQDAKVH